MTGVLELRGVSVDIDGRRLIDDVDLTVESGEIVALLGPSGCGKSTLLRAVTGLVPLAAGAVRFSDRDLTRVPPHRRGMALMFQDGQLFGHRSVAQNIAYPMRIRRLERARVRSEVARLLELVGLSGFGGRRIDDLSGGERQRVALARVLAVEPEVVMLDEPLASLDRQLRDRLLDDLRAILAAADVGGIFVTHDHEEAFAVADSMALMREGRLIQRGSLSEVWGHPVDAEAALFLGYATILPPDEAARLARAAGRSVPSAARALRRSALVVRSEGALRATVLEARPTPDVLRLVVEIPGFGRAHAVDEPGSRRSVGEIVTLDLDLDRTAPVGSRGDGPYGP